MHNVHRGAQIMHAYARCTPQYAYVGSSMHKCLQELHEDALILHVWVGLCTILLTPAHPCISIAETCIRPAHMVRDNTHRCTFTASSMLFELSHAHFMYYLYKLLSALCIDMHKTCIFEDLYSRKHSFCNSEGKVYKYAWYINFNAENTCA